VVRSAHSNDSQARREGGVGGVNYSGTSDVWGPRRRAEIQKYTRMHNFKKIQNFSPEGPRENVWGPHENVSPSPAVALDGPGDSWALVAILSLGHSAEDSR